LAATTKTNVTSTVRTKYETKILDMVKGMLVAPKFCKPRSVESGGGDTVRVNRMLRTAKVTSVSTSGTRIAGSSAKAFYTNYKEYSMENWGDSFGLDEDVPVTSFLKKPDFQENVANQMSRSLEYQAIKKISTQCLRHRIDKDANYQVTGTADSGSTTTLVDDALDFGTDDYWNGGYLTITGPEGANFDIGTVVTDSAEGSDTVTVGTQGQAYASSSKYSLTKGTALAATDILTTDALLDVSARHELLETPTWNNGQYRAFMHAAQHRDLWADTTFVNSAIYDNSGRFKTLKVGRWFDIEFLVSSELYREDVDGTENQATGIVYVMPIFGNDAYTIISFANPGGSGKFSVKFMYVDQPDSENLRLSETYMSWKGMWAGGVDYATRCIGLMTGATSMGLVV